MNNASSFEQSLRAAVKRLAKGDFEDAIREVVEHYQDLHGEAQSQGVSNQEAQQFATHRIGILGDIARQIVNSTSRVKNGIKLQRFGIGIWIIAPFSLMVISLIINETRPKAFTSIFTTILLQIATNSVNYVFLAGILFAVGVFRSGKLSMKTLAFGVATYLVLAGGLFAWLNSKSGPSSELHSGIEAQIQLETHYQRLEESLAAGLAKGDQIDEPTLAAFRTAALTKQLPSVTFNQIHPMKYAYPYGLVANRKGEMDTLYLGTTDSLEDARIHWRFPGFSSSEIPNMTCERENYFDHLRNITSTSLSPSYIALFALFHYTWPFLLGFLTATGWTRFSLYRLDSFKLRLKRS